MTSQVATGARGFSLLEMAVATLLLGLAAAGLLGTLGDALAAAQAARDADRATDLARNALNELLATGPPLAGRAIRGSDGDRFGWRAWGESADRFGKDSEGRGLAKIQAEVWWFSRGERKTARLESFARTGSP